MKHRCHSWLSGSLSHLAAGALVAVFSLTVPTARAVTNPTAPWFADPKISHPARTYPAPSGTIFYASPTGVDTNSGTSSGSPWTLNKALTSSSVPAGATVVVRGGTYYDVGDITLNKPLIIQAAANEYPWIKGSVTLPVAGQTWTQDTSVSGGNYWYTAWSSKTDPPAYMQGNPTQYFYTGDPSAGDGDMVFISIPGAGAALRPLSQVGGWVWSGNPAITSLSQAASRGLSTSYRFWVDTARGRLYISLPGGDTPGAHLVESAKRNSFLRLNNGAAGTVLRGLGIAMYTAKAIGSPNGTAASPDVTLQENAIVWNGLVGLNIKGERMKLLRNVFSCNGSQGVGVGSSDDFLADGNLFSYNNVEHFRLGWEAGGLKIIESLRTVLRNNLADTNFCVGLWLDVSNNDALVVNNRCRNNDTGIFFEISDTALIAFNVCTNNREGIDVANSTNARVFNNTVVNNGKGLFFKYTNRENDEGGFFPMFDNFAKNNLMWSNRTSVFNSEDSLLDPGNGYDPAPFTPSSARLTQSNDNAFYRANVNFPPKAIFWTKDGGNTVTSYTTIADFLSMRIATPQGTYDYESRSHETISASDPFFVNPGAEDYRLKNGSANPAYDRGQSLPSDIVAAFNSSLPTARSWSPNQPSDPLLVGSQVDQGAIQRN